ncbi:MAG: DeoR/GlpR transcriptional regulator [Curvibacter sp.]|nr:DeoR/GlpR transcriptional regulator [Curvibacter sp.]
MNPQQRRQKVLQLLNEQHSLRVPELADALAVSAATLRRDLGQLAADQLIKRGHGKVERVEQPAQAMLKGSSFVQNAGHRSRQKRAIARRAAELCHEGDTVIINGGSTTFGMAQFLADRRMTILTNSFLLAQQLLVHSRNDVLLPGGMVYREQNVIASPFASDVIRNHYASKMFMGACGISPLGVLETDPLLVQAELKLMAQAHTLVLLVDSSKFSASVAGLIVCPLRRIELLITDKGIRPDTLRHLRSEGVEVMVVDADREDLP